MRSLSWSRPVNALGAKGEPLSLCVTHPYHPLCGQTFEWAAQNREFGEDRVFYRDPNGRMRFLPALDQPGVSPSLRHNGSRQSLLPHGGPDPTGRTDTGAADMSTRATRKKNWTCGRLSINECQAGEPPKMEFGNACLFNKKSAARRDRVQELPVRQRGYLVDVIPELHQACSYREQPGSCATCQGTSVADCQPQ